MNSIWFFFWLLLLLLWIANFCFLYKLRLFSGLITTTARKLDRENQSEHILEVCIFMLEFFCYQFLFFYTWTAGIFFLIALSFVIWSNFDDYSCYYFLSSTTSPSFTLLLCSVLSLSWFYFWLLSIFSWHETLIGMPICFGAFQFWYMFALSKEVKAINFLERIVYFPFYHCIGSGVWRSNQFQYVLVYGAFSLFFFSLYHHFAVFYVLFSNGCHAILMKGIHTSLMFPSIIWIIPEHSAVICARLFGVLARFVFILL